jgi:CubicO group peptidase (beta-lactamase class C family)
MAAPEGEPPPISSLGGQALSAESIEAFAVKRMAAHRTPALQLAIVSDGVVVHEAAFGSANAATGEAVDIHTRFEAASLSKPLFAYFMMGLVEEGVIDLDRPLGDYFPHPDLGADPRAVTLTARRVLSHQTGLPNWRSAPGFEGDWRDAYQTLPLRFERDPGSGLSYSGEAYQYLAQAAAAAAGVDAAGLQQMFADRVSGPLGLARTVFMEGSCRKGKASPHRAGAVIDDEPPLPNDFAPAYGAVATAGDYARFLSAIIGGRGLKPETMAAFLAPQGVVIPDDHPERALGLVDWSLGFSVYQTPAGRLYVHGGDNPGYKSVAVFSLDRRWGFVALANDDGATGLLIELFEFLSGP